MNLFEAEYRNTVNRLAFALLMFSCFFLVVALVAVFLPYVTGLLASPFDEITGELTYTVLYAAVFLLPFVFFCLVSDKRPIAPMFLKMKMGRDVPLYMFIGLAAVFAAGYVNGALADLFDFSLPAGNAIAKTEYTNLALILRLIRGAVVPAFVEEFLFRGVVLTNLLPFGKKSAIIASAVLFGLAHQNVSQLFYATVAGLVLGYVYVKARSIWPCVLIHFVNNFISVLQSALYDRLQGATATAFVLVMQAVIMTLGVVSFVVLLLRKGKEPRAESAEAQSEQPVASDPDAALSFGRRVRLFFSPAMTAFVVVTLVQTVFSLVTSILGST